MEVLTKNLDERRRVGCNVDDSESGDRCIIQSGDVAFVITRDNNAQVLRQVFITDGAQRDESQRTRSHVRRGSVDLVQEQNRLFIWIGFCIANCLADCGVWEELLRPHPRLFIQNKTCARQVSLVSKHVARQGKAPGVGASGHVLDERGLADARFAHEGWDAVGVQ